MSRQLEQAIEDRASRNKDLLIRAVYGGLDASIQSAGFELHGFSVKLTGGDCLLTLRASSASGAFIAYVGASDLPAALVKSVREARGGELRWKPDRYAK
jgi:hypothetical protein